MILFNQHTFLNILLEKKIKYWNKVKYLSKNVNKFYIIKEQFLKLLNETKITCFECKCKIL